MEELTLTSKHYIMSILETLGSTLKTHAHMVASGVNSNRAMKLVTNADLSFKSEPISITQSFRDQLHTIAQGVDVNINNLLNMLTPQQVEQAISDHKHIQWSDPDCESGERSMRLDCIERDGNKQEWWLGFTTEEARDGDKPLLVYRLHSLEIQQVLAFMQTIENVLIPSPLINEKV